jgi:two-component system, chemotaxis family, protein-glutamate methylesterase/glutaminase
MSNGYELARPAALSCPECAGTMYRDVHQGLLQFRCHTGHRLTGEAMLHAQLARLEYRLGSCFALLNERAELCRQLGEAAREAGQEAHHLGAAREQALERARSVQTLMEAPWLRPENLTAPG